MSSAKTRSRQRLSLSEKLNREAKRLYGQLTNPRATLARRASRYLDSYNGYSYDFEKNGEKELVKKLSKLDPRTVFDVGANVGDWATMALESFPNAIVHCFELSKSTHATLTMNVTNERAILNNLGLAADNGVFSYKDYGSNSQVNTLLLSATYHDSADLQPVMMESELIRGDDYCLSRDIKFIDFMKIDVEGAEHLVLRGLTKMLGEKAVRLLQFEYGYTNGDSKFLMRDFFDLFDGFGYLVGRVRRGGIKFENWTYEYNDFKSGPNYVAVRREDTELIAELSR
jgi:FkbM family methyltransferase